MPSKNHELTPYRNRALVILMRHIPTIYQVRQAFKCTKCGHMPDKRNMKRSFAKYKRKYANYGCK